MTPPQARSKDLTVRRPANNSSVAGRTPADAWHAEARCRTCGDHVEIEACSSSRLPPSVQQPDTATHAHHGRLEQRVSPAPSVWSRTGSAGPRVRADGYWQAGNLTWGRQTSGMPSMKTGHCGTSRAPPGCPPTWFAASSPSPGTGGKATPTQTGRPGGAPDRRPPGRLPCGAGSRGYITHGPVISRRARARWGLPAITTTDQIFRTPPSANPLNKGRPARVSPGRSGHLAGRRVDARVMVGGWRQCGCCRLLLPYAVATTRL
jgi:hypothetical protein